MVQKCLLFVLRKLNNIFDQTRILYMAFLDPARKPHTLFKLGVPKWIIKVIDQWHCNQSVCVQDGDQYYLISFSLTMV